MASLRAKTELVLVLDQKFKELDDDGLFEVILDAGSPEVGDHGIQVLLGNEQGVDLLGDNKVLVEPLVALVEQAGEEHGVLRNELLVVTILDFFSVLPEQITIIKVGLFHHAVHDISEA